MRIRFYPTKTTGEGKLRLCAILNRSQNFKTTIPLSIDVKYWDKTKQFASGSDGANEFNQQLDQVRLEGLK